MLIKNNTIAAETNKNIDFLKRQPKGRPAIEIGSIIVDKKTDQSG